MPNKRKYLLKKLNNFAPNNCNLDTLIDFIKSAPEFLINPIYEAEEFHQNVYFETFAKGWVAGQLYLQKTLDK